MSKLEENEVELLRANIKYGKDDMDTQLVLTSERIIFEQERGLFKKKLRPVYMVNIDDIKMYKEQVKIEQKNRTVSMQTKNRDVSFVCDNIIEAKKIIEKIIDIRTDSCLFDRTAEKAKKIVKRAIAIAGVAGTAAVGIAKNKKTVLKAVNGVTNLIKK